LKKGVLTNLILRSKLEASHSDDSLQERAAIRKELTLSPQSVAALFEKMERLVGRLEFQRETTWGDYERTNSYADEEQTVRDDVIEDFVSASQNTGWALDVGANTGRHSALLAKTFDNVISVDIDEVAVEVHRRRLIEAPPAGTIFPVLADLAAPTSASGFLLEERQDLLQRISGVDATIWMVVIHHLVIGRSVPLSGVAEMAYRIGERHLIEFVDPADLMVQLLSASKNAEHHLYTKEAFVEAFSTRFEVREVAQPTPTRYIFEAAVE
jgi:SAM-dependent methyltransferase